MASRREFIQVGIAASVLPIAANAGGRTPDLVTSVDQFYRVIFDHRFAASREFGSDMEKLGATVIGIHGDITDFWFHDLYHRWKKGPAPIAGMTAHGVLFCLERLAWDQGMRVLSRTNHSFTDECEPLITWAIGAKPKS